MADQNPEPEVILYDLACTKDVCFSPVVWRIRLMLNYKRIPYKTVFLEFPDIAPTLQGLGIPLPESAPRYTVPAIHHLATNTYLMDSVPISQFLESSYPNPPLPLSSDLGTQIEARARSVAGRAHAQLTIPREVHILAPESQSYFRGRAEPMLGKSLEEGLLNEQQQDELWKTIEDDLCAVGQLMRKHKDDGPFILGKEPSYADFMIAGSMQSARVINEEGLWRRYMSLEGFREVYDACAPYMERKD